MSKLNKKNTQQVDISENGNLQSVKDPEQVLFETLVSTLYGNDSYYESSNDKVQRMISSLQSVIKRYGVKGSNYAARLAIFAREQMFIRTMPIVMVVELAKIVREQNINLTKTDITVRELVSKVIQRADELTDLYSYALTVFGSKSNIPMSIKKGVGDAFNKFDEYQFAKYNRDTSLKFKDLLRIIHPKPIDDTKGMIFSKIISETLESPYTWEVELSKNGQLPREEQKSKCQLWTELIMKEGSGSIGYMALLRNLRNMKEAQINDETWKMVAEKISDPIQVKKSKQLPFRFINAVDIAKENNLPTLILSALSDATEMSLNNIPKLGERVWIILDCSGSMNYSDKSKNSPIKTGAILSSALIKASKSSFEVRLTMFDDYAKNVELDVNDSIFTSYTKIMDRNAGGGTNLQSALDQKDQLGFEPDTVIVLSDMEVDRLNHSDITNLFSKDCLLIAVNLASKNTTPLPERMGWIQLSGWSENMFKYVEFKRNGSNIVKQLFEGTHEELL